MRKDYKKLIIRHRNKRKRKKTVMLKQKIQQDTKYRKEEKQRKAQEKAQRKSKPDNKIVKLKITVERPPCKKCQQKPRRHGSAYCGVC